MGTATCCMVQSKTSSKLAKTGRNLATPLKEWPCLVMIPPGIWHGLQCLGNTDALLLNCPTEAYNYADPDHYRLPWDTPEIPYVWKVTDAAKVRQDRRQ